MTAAWKTPAALNFMTWRSGRTLLSPEATKLFRTLPQAQVPRGLKLTAAAVPVPERELQGFPGPIASSDTALIEAQPLVVDLAGEIIRRELGLRPIELNTPGPEEQMLSSYSPEAPEDS